MTDNLNFDTVHIMLSIEELNNEIDEMFDEQSDEESVNDNETYDDWEKWDGSIPEPQKHVRFAPLIEDYTTHTYIEVVFDNPRWFAGCYKPFEYYHPLVFDMNTNLCDVYNVIDEKHSIKEDIKAARKRKDFVKARAMKAKLKELERLYK